VNVSQLEAVLFDMDGTLVDSEKVWTIGLHELARRHGGELSPPARVAMIGTNMVETMNILHADIAQPWLDPEASVTWLEDRVRALFADGLVWRPGARELLTAVRGAGITTALVTSTRRNLVDVALDTLGVHNFDVVVCGDEVDNSKPHPEPYLTAAAALGVDPGRCVAVEDSPIGVSSARAAGCVVVAVPCDVPVLESEGVVHLDSLELADVATLQRLVLRSAAA
jgi:HAD superfamily hydrolase (TIGR01509 family)